MQMKRTVLYFFLLCAGMSASAQKIHLDCPALSGKPGKLYWQKGGVVDSLPTVLDAKGQATQQLPDARQKMLYTLVIEGSGVQFVGGEPNVTLTCTGTPLTKQNLKITGSKENDFLYRIFDGKSNNIRKQAWIEAGLQQYDAKNALYPLLIDEKRRTLEAYKVLDEEERSSSFFAAAFLRHNEFLERLFQAENKKDTLLSVQVQKELEETLDFSTLYGCAELWNSIPNYYISMFNKIDKPNKRDAFAASACKILDRLKEPYYCALLTRFITETERFNWLAAGETIVKHALATRPGIKETSDLSPTVKRILAMVTVSERATAPALQVTTFTVDDKGITQQTQKTMRPEGKNGALLIFFDSSCEYCVHEMKLVRENYAALKQKGIRVISVASDTDRKSYESYAADFPWSDKLFDGKGFMGENFKNYALLGSPTLYVIDKDGKIAGRYATFAETKLLDK